MPLAAYSSVSGVLPAFHSLTFAELEASPVDSPEYELAMVRVLGQQDQTAGIERLKQLSGRAMNDDQRLITTAYECELNVRRGEMAMALPYCLELEDSIEARDVDPLSRAIAGNALGYLYVRRGQGEKALAQFERALRDVSQVDPVLRVTVLHNRGVALMLSGLTDLAIEAFEDTKAEKSVLPLDSPLPMILAYNLGYVQAQSENHEAALASYRIIQPWLVETGQLTRSYIAHTQIALSLSGLGRHQEALETLKPWVLRADIAVSPDSAAQAQFALGKAHLGLGQRAQAEEAVLKGIDIASGSHNPGRLRELSVLYGEMLLSDENAEGAAEYLRGFLDQYQTGEFGLELAPAHRLLSQAFAENGDFEQALHHSLIASESFEKAQQADFGRRLASLSITNELDVKDQQLYLSEAREKALEASKQLTLTILIAGGLAALLIFALLFVLQRQRAKAKESEMHREVSERLKREVAIRTGEVEEALKQHSELQIRLVQDEKLRMIGQLTGGVAHDFNNLLTVIQLSSELLLLELKGEQRALIEDIINASESGKSITSGLLAYARQQVLQPTLIDLTSFFQSNEALFRRTAKDEIEFSLEIRGDGLPCLIRADVGQLVSAILNLILNASEASDRVSSSAVCKVSRQGEYVDIVISDNGKGMTPDELKSATEPFYTTKGLAGGSGLGLAMVEGFMTQSGGELMIESEVGVGTTITLRFVAAESGQSTVTVEPFTETDGRKRQVLIVEDEEPIRAVGKLALETAGYQVHLAVDADDALSVIETLPELDLLISDVVMPGSMSGRELADHMRAQRPDLPILLITGYSSSVTADHPVLLKPFRLDELLSRVQALLEPTLKVAVPG